MNAAQLFRAGQLEEATALLSQELRAAPMDDGRRSFLVELLCLNGQWERALRVLDGMRDPRDPRTQTYRRLLRAEQKRRAFLSGGATPRVLGEDVLSVKLDAYLLAAPALECGDEERALKLLSSAEEARPRVRGVRSGQPFADLRDADDRFAAVLEVLDGEDYGWLPFAALRSIRVQAPRHPFDFVFFHALVDIGKGPWPICIPTRYPGSERASAPALRLARQTTTIEGSTVRCLGQRVLLVGDQVVPLLQLDSLHVSIKVP